MKNYIIIGLVSALILGIVANYAQNMRQQRDEKARQVSTLQDNLDTVLRLSNEQEATIRKMQQRERENENEQQRIRGTIKQAPKADNGLIAPVLRRTLVELRSVQERHGSAGRQ